MSNNTKLLSSILPADVKVNGLDTIQQELCDDPSTPRVAIVVFDAFDYTVNVETGVRVPRARILRFEPIGTADALGAAYPDLQKAYDDAFRRRSNGQEPLPLDEVQVEIVDDEGGE